MTKTNPIYSPSYCSTTDKVKHRITNNVGEDSGPVGAYNDLQFFDHFIIPKRQNFIFLIWRKINFCQLSYSCFLKLPLRKTQPYKRSFRHENIIKEIIMIFDKFSSMNIESFTMMKVS